MAAPASQMLSLEEAYSNAFPQSYLLYQRALKRFPNGVTHDGRYLLPFPIYVTHAQGSRKWTADGAELIDYWMGHGSLLFGHGRPEIVKAIVDQAQRGTHYGACHELEIEWADWITRLMPSAEAVRFVSSGTEATLMAIRLARAYTGKRKVVKFQGHYHGWHDNVMDGTGPNHGSPQPGILPEVFESLISLPSPDLNLVEETLRTDSDIACLMLEPTGALFGGVEVPDGFVTGLRALTARYGVLFVMDEVVTGFRCAPGGAQEVYKVRPDLTTLAKIVAGGLQGGVVLGRKDILELLEIRPDTAWNTNRKMIHYGTFNASPVSAAAGVAALKLVADGREIAVANERAAQLRARFAEVIAAHHLTDWRVFGSFSGVKIAYSTNPAVSRRSNLRLIHAIRQGMLLHGVDFVGVDGLTSSAHTPEETDLTAKALDATLGLLRQDGII